MNPKLYHRASYNHSQKMTFHRHAKRQLKILATKHFGLTPDQFDLRSNLAGIAVSGEITLETPFIYIQASQPISYRDCGLLIRHDTHGRNHFAPLSKLDDLETFGKEIAAFRNPIHPYWIPPSWGWAPYQLPALNISQEVA